MCGKTTKNNIPLKCGLQNQPSRCARSIWVCGGRVREVSFILPQEHSICVKGWRKKCTCLEKQKDTRNKKILLYNAKSKNLFSLPVPVWPKASSQPRETPDKDCKETSERVMGLVLFNCTQLLPTAVNEILFVSSFAISDKRRPAEHSHALGPGLVDPSYGNVVSMEPKRHATRIIVWNVLKARTAESWVPGIAAPKGSERLFAFNNAFVPRGWVMAPDRREEFVREHVCLKHVAARLFEGQVAHGRPREPHRQRHSSHQITIAFMRMLATGAYVPDGAQIFQ